MLRGARRLELTPNILRYILPRRCKRRLSVHEYVSEHIPISGSAALGRNSRFQLD